MRRIPTRRSISEGMKPRQFVPSTEKIARLPGLRWLACRVHSGMTAAGPSRRPAWQRRARGRWRGLGRREAVPGRELARSRIRFPLARPLTRPTSRVAAQPRTAADGRRLRDLCCLKGRGNGSGRAEDEGRGAILVRGQLSPRCTHAVGKECPTRPPGSLRSIGSWGSRLAGRASTFGFSSPIVDFPGRTAWVYLPPDSIERTHP